MGAWWGWGCWRRTLCLWAVVMCSSLFMPCEGSGHLEIKFVSYWSNCRDNTFFFGLFERPCDTVFDICIDKPGNVDFSSCYYEYRATRKVHENSNQIQFNDQIGHIDNPRVLEFYNFQEKRVMLAVKVTDDEAVLSDEVLATLSSTFSFVPAADKRRAHWTSKTMSTHNKYTYRITFEYRAYCDAYYYTTMCDVYCRARNDSLGHYTCNSRTGQKECLPGWTGLNCATDINECLQGPCFNNANCTNLPGSYECRCSNGFIGKNCDLIGSACYSSPCQHGGTCSGNMQHYSCHCPPEWTGRNCDVMVDFCQPDSCQNNGTCSPTVGDFTCSCPPGWTGQYCVTEVDACDSLPCQHGGTCGKKPRGEYECSCTEEYEGRDCGVLKNPCDSSPCMNSGTCHRLTHVSYTCACLDGWEGEQCERHTDICDTVPCKNGASCSSSISSSSSSSSSDGGYVCHCSPGWKGDNCTTEMNPCDDLPCQQGGACTKLSGTQYTCLCPQGYDGVHCEILTDLCITNPCKNDATCVNTDGAYVCHCVPGWTGENCETEANPCDDLPCQNGGVCSKLPGLHYQCSCPMQYEGQNCEQLRDPCRSNPCYHGTCVRVSHSLFRCECNRQWSGVYCQRASSETHPGLQMGEHKDDKKPPVLYIILGCLSACLLLIIFIILLVFRRRRRQQKKTAAAGGRTAGSRSDSVSTVVTVTDSEVGGSTFPGLPDSSRDYPAVGFQNRLFGPGSVCKDRLWDRPQMPLPSLLPQGGLGLGYGVEPGQVFFPGKAARVRVPVPEGEVEGAVGGRVETCSLKAGVVSWSKKSSYPQAGGENNGRVKPAANDYADFADLQRRVDASRRTAQVEEPAEDFEENHYHSLDDLSLDGTPHASGTTALKDRTAAKEAALEDVPSTDEEDDEGVSQEDLNRLRREVLDRSINRRH